MVKIVNETSLVLNVEDIRSRNISKQISVVGKVKVLYEPHLVVTEAVFKCKWCGNTYKIIQIPNSAGNAKLKEPPFCECRHRDFELVGEESTFIDWQKMRLRSETVGNKATLDLGLRKELVNKFRIGQCVKITGVLKVEITPKTTKYFLDAERLLDYASVA
jgi:replicative DNA helicase Mcm